MAEGNGVQPDAAAFSPSEGRKPTAGNWANGESGTEAGGIRRGGSFSMPIKADRLSAFWRCEDLVELVGKLLDTERLLDKAAATTL